MISPFKRGANPVSIRNSRNGAGNLRSIPTYELVKELKKREGVETHMIGPSACVTVKADGPAVVFVVID